MKPYIRFKPQRWENQGIQHRARFFVAIGFGHWWKAGIGIFSYADHGKDDDLRGGWIEIMLGWVRLVGSFPMSAPERKEGE